MRRFLRENGLSVVLFALFLGSLAGQSLTGLRSYNHEQEEHGGRPIRYAQYLHSGAFTEAVFENWESEFLQMAAYVLLTVFLRQKGSPESRKLEGEEPVDADPRKSTRKDAPWPVRKRGWMLRLYENSLSIVLFLLFLISFTLHLIGSNAEYNQDQLEHGGQALPLGEYLQTSRFWFESFQNWQSEFLSIGVLIVLAIFLRQRGSPESKPVDHPHWLTGRE
jgi:hypothetical protein